MLFHVRKDYNRLFCLRIRGLYNPQLIGAFLRRLSPCEFYCPVKPDALVSDRILADYLVLDVDPKYLHPDELGKLHTVGRLDIDTEGLLILTTDGLFSHRLTLPESHVSKTYLVYLRDYCDEKTRVAYADAFARGLYLEKEKHGSEFLSKPATIDWLDGENEYCNLVSSGPHVDFNICLLTISEGKFHQVKRMFSAVGNEVIFLKRISIGNLKLDASLLPGQYRPLTDEELEGLG